MKYTQHSANADGWSDWIIPVMKGFKHCCCDCGLVHVMEFTVVEKTGPWNPGSWPSLPLDQRRYRVEFRLRRDNLAKGRGE